MKHRTCFVCVPRGFGTTDAPTKGKYTMYYYGPSSVEPDHVIVESLKGWLGTVPKEWVHLI